MLDFGWFSEELQLWQGDHVPKATCWHHLCWMDDPLPMVCLDIELDVRGWLVGRSVRTSGFPMQRRPSRCSQSDEEQPLHELPDQLSQGPRWSNP